jgi:hypothetical protein
LHNELNGLLQVPLPLTLTLTLTLTLPLTLTRRDGLLSLASKAPEWSEELKTYTLEYNNRATLASVKNISI